MFRPHHQGLENSFFIWYIEVITGEQTTYFLCRQYQKFLIVHYLNKIIHEICVGDFVQVGASLSVGELADADTVGGVELLHEEATARLHHLG